MTTTTEKNDECHSNDNISIGFEKWREENLIDRFYIQKLFKNIFWNERKKWIDKTFKQAKKKIYWHWKKWTKSSSSTEEEEEYWTRLTEQNEKKIPESCHWICIEHNNHHQFTNLISHHYHYHLTECFFIIINIYHWNKQNIHKHKMNEW